MASPTFPSHRMLQPEGAARLALGVMRLLEWSLTPKALAAFLAQSAEAGIQVLDTADIYGRGAVEPALGAAFRELPGLREHFRLVGKCGIRLFSESAPKVAVKHYDTSAAHVVAQVDGTLRHLGTDHLELLLIHRPDPLMEVEELAATFEALRSSGKVLAFGVSNFRPAQVDLLQARCSLPLVTNQVEASLWHPAPLLDGTLDHAQQNGQMPMAWSPLGGGRPAPAQLAATLDRQGTARGWTPAQVALAWLARHPTGILPVLGTGQIHRVREAVFAMNQILDRETWFELLEAAVGHPVA